MGLNCAFQRVMFGLLPDKEPMRAICKHIRSSHCQVPSKVVDRRSAPIALNTTAVDALSDVVHFQTETAIVRQVDHRRPILKVAVEWAGVSPWWLGDGGERPMRNLIP
jgi:hypothetical protein